MSQTTDHSNHSDLASTHGHRIPEGESLRWLDKPANVNKLCIALYVLCGITIIAEFFIHKHGHFRFEDWFAFHAWFGFGSYCFLIFTAKGIRKLIKRDEDYYDV